MSRYLTQAMTARERVHIANPDVGCFEEWGDHGPTCDALTAAILAAQSDERARLCADLTAYAATLGDDFAQAVWFARDRLLALPPEDVKP